MKHVNELMMELERLRNPAGLSGMSGLSAGGEKKIDDDQVGTVSGMSGLSEARERKNTEVGEGTKVHNQENRLSSSFINSLSPSPALLRTPPFSLGPPTNPTNPTNTSAPAISQGFEAATAIPTNPTSSTNQILPPATFAGNTYVCREWLPADGCVGPVIGFDTETTLIVGHEVPTFVLGAAFDGQTVYFVTPEHLGVFCAAHAGAKQYFCNAPFDLDVVGKACGFDYLSAVRQGTVLDVQIIYRLLELGRKGQLPQRYNLGLLSETLLGQPLDKESDTRLGFGRFLQDGRVDLRQIDHASLQYLAMDAIATCLLGAKLEAEARALADQYKVPGLLTHDTQLLGAWATTRITRLGAGVDVQRAQRRLAEVQALEQQAVALLRPFGYVPGAKGNMAVFDRLMTAIEAQRSLQLLRTKDGRITQSDDQLASVKDDAFVAAFLAYKEQHKLTGVIKKLADSGGRLHPRYSLAVSGRALCSSPNLQQLPREGGVRECIVAPTGYVLLAGDYKCVEMVALAEICFQLYDNSALRDILNAGGDPHRLVAARILNKDAELVTKEERQQAKAVNFGIPGGMGVTGFLDYARQNYGVTFTRELAEEFFEKWYALFPEVRRYLDERRGLGGLFDLFDFTNYPRFYAENALSNAARCLVRIAGGNVATSHDREFSQAEIDWVWQQLQRCALINDPQLRADVQSRRGSWRLRHELASHQVSVTPTGRIRAECSGTEASNSPFQSLAADGCKLAFSELVLARGFRVVLLVHDEIVVEVPDTLELSMRADEMRQVMVEQMRRVCPNVRVEVELAASRCWSKKAKAMYDATGRLVPWIEPKEGGQ